MRSHSTLIGLFFAMFWVVFIVAILLSIIRFFRRVGQWNVGLKTGLFGGHGLMTTLVRSQAMNAQLVLNGVPLRDKTAASVAISYRARSKSPAADGAPGNALADYAQLAITVRQAIERGVRDGLATITSEELRSRTQDVQATLQKKLAGDLSALDSDLSSLQIINISLDDQPVTIVQEDPAPPRLESPAWGTLCQQCHRPVDPQHRFCPRCGSHLIAAPEPTDVPTRQQPG